MAAMRTIIDLPDRQIEELERLVRSRNLSRAELIRQAIERYLQENAPAREEAFGLWKGAGARQDGLALQRRLRKEWDR
jgi:metal-responsive CopG/Arc/MetJ family transcriptional regulator